MRYCFTVGLIFLTFGLKAQSDFRKGYIVKNNLDTLYGLIDYRGTKASATKCLFRQTAESSIQEFTPQEVKSFRFVNSRFYVSRQVKSGDSSEQLFLEYVIDGIVDFYYYYDDAGEHFLIEDPDGRLTELKNDKKEIFVDNQRYLRESKEYVGVLKAILKDSPSTTKKAERTSFNRKALTKLVEDYHVRLGKESDFQTYEVDIPMAKGVFGLVLSMNGTSISQSGDFPLEYYYLDGSKFKGKVYPSIGLFYKKGLPIISEKVFFLYEGTYSRASLSSSNDYNQGTSTLVWHNDITISLSSFNNLLAFRYEYPTGSIRPTLQFGGFASYIFQTDYTRKVEVILLDELPYFSEEHHDNPLSKLDFGLSIGAGLKGFYLGGRELYLDFRFQKGFGLIEGLSSHTFSANLGFQLSR